MRPASVVLPVLRSALTGVEILTRMPDPQHRSYPCVSIRRVGGVRNRTFPKFLGFGLLELSAFSADGPGAAEKLYEEAVEALYRGAADQAAIPGVGYLHSLSESAGPSAQPSPFEETWQVSGTVKVGLRTV